jgi:stage II sporulation SpoAA-like protein
LHRVIGVWVLGIRFVLTSTRTVSDQETDMSVSVNLENSRLLVVRLSGKVTAQQFRAAQQEASELLKPIVSVSVVVVLQGFEGWGPGDWNDSLIQFRHDTQIKRMAIVGDPKWEDAALLFVGKGLRHFDIEYFEPAQLTQAREWASSGARSAAQWVNPPAGEGATS